MSSEAHPCRFSIGAGPGFLRVLLQSNSDEMSTPSAKMNWLNEIRESDFTNKGSREWIVLVPIPALREQVAELRFPLGVPYSSVGDLEIYDELSCLHPSCIIVAGECFRLKSASQLCCR